VQREGRYEQASKLRFATIPELERQLPSETERAKGTSGTTLIHDRVTSSDIARVVARATGAGSKPAKGRNGEANTRASSFRSDIGFVIESVLSS